LVLLKKMSSNSCNKFLNDYLKCVNKYSNTNVCQYLLNDYNKCVEGENLNEYLLNEPKKQGGPRFPQASSLKEN